MPKCNDRFCRGFRQGFTLIELLVVVAIIGILIGLLLPAVQQVREAARRMKCANNIKQQSLAILNYENAHQHYPAGFRYPGGTMWTGFILPFMEQGNLFDGLNLSGPWDAHAGVTPNSLALGTPIESFRCPSANLDLVQFDSFSATDRSPCSYLACASGLNNRESGDYPWCGMPRLGNLAESDGIFFCNSSTTHAGILDGTSNTVLIGEAFPDQSLTGDDYSGNAQKVDHWYIGSSEVGDYSLTGISAEVSECLGSTACPINSIRVAGSPVNDKELSFSSRHAGGANIGYADGHILFVAEDVDLGVWSAVGTRDWGEAGTSMD